MALSLPLYAQSPLIELQSQARSHVRLSAAAVDLAVTLVAVNRKEPTPFAAVSKTKLRQCVVVLNTSEPAHENWQRLLSLGKMPEESLLEFTIAHEVAHCVNQRYALKYPEDPVLSSPLSPGQDSENFADLYAIWLLSYQQLESRLYSEDLDFHEPSEKSIHMASLVLNLRKNWGFLYRFNAAQLRAMHRELINGPWPQTPKEAAIRIRSILAEY